MAGPIGTLTGGSVYNRRMASALAALGWQVEIRELLGAFPDPSARALEDAEAVYAALPDGTTVVADGLAFSAIPDTAERHGRRLRLVALVHLPIAAASGLTPERVRRFETSEARALAAASRIVVTGPGSIDALARYRLEAGKVALVAPGVDAAPLSRGSADGGVHLLCVATLNAGKGHDVLARALARGVGRGADAASGSPVPWHLTLAGSVSRDAATAARVRALIEALGLESRVTIAGELDGAALDEAWDRADVFVLATLGETYGMAVAEALARGLPVVSTATGAIPRLVGDDAGLIVPPGNEEALARALARVIGEPPLRRRLAAGARRARAGLRSWDDAANEMAEVLAE